MTKQLSSQYIKKQNFKTINGESIVGQGGITIQGGVTGTEPTVMTVDNSLLKIWKGNAADHASLRLEENTIYLVKVE